MVLKHSLEDVYEKICTSIHICFPGPSSPRSIKSNSFYVISLVSCPLSVICASSHVLLSLVLMQISIPVLSVVSHTLISCDKIEETNALMQCFIPFPLTPNSRPSDDILKVWTKCLTMHTRCNKYWTHFSPRMVLLMHTMTFFCGSASLQGVYNGTITPDDTLLMISIDGAQLYESKESDCWIYIWIILELSPDHCYKKKHILPSAIIPGPKKPKFIESFLSPGLHHLSALQCEGLRIWDLAHNCDFIIRLFLFLACTNGPGLLTMSNFVGHQGKNGCHMRCPLKGHWKPGTSQYYPVLLKPNKYNVPGCTHDNVDVYKIGPSTLEKYVQQLYYLLQACTQKDYEMCCLETGIVGPSILLGLQPHLVLSILECFSSEMMQLSGANMATLWLDLWRGTIDCASTDNRVNWHWSVLREQCRWEEHGRAVAACKPYLPGLFDVTPCDPSLHENLWYKATEYITWIYSLCPVLLFQVLPHDI